MHVALVQLDIAWEDKAVNHGQIEEMLAAADPAPATFVLLPELGDTGFSFDLDVIVDDRTLPWARDLARTREVWVQAGFATRGPDGKGRNCAAIISPEGAVTGTYEKVHPFSFGREVEHFTGGDRIVIRRCGDANVCPLVCYDLRFPELWRLAARPRPRAGDGDRANDTGRAGGPDADAPAAPAGAEVFTIGASWPDARQAHWRALAIARAIENQAYVVAVNRVGADPHLGYAGGSLVVSPTGTILAEAGDRPAVLEADLDLPALRRWRREFPALRDIRPEMLGSFAVDADTS